MRKKVSDILNGFDRAMDKIETMPVTAGEKKRLVKEWLRARLAEMQGSDDDGNQQASPRSRS